MGFVLVVQNWEFKKMGFPPFLVLLAFFLVSQLLVIHSSGSCPSSFDCGPLDPIKFPFTSNKHPLCGWYNVSCDEPDPKVKLGEEGKSYQVSSLTNDAIKFNDPGLKTLIESNNICNLFSYINPLMTLNTPSISFTISPSLTLFKCNTSSPELEDQTNKHFLGTYSTYTVKGGPCPGYTVYHSHPNQQIPLPTPDSYPTNCIFIQLPVVSSFEDWDRGDPFTLLTSDFSVGYHLSKECLTCLDDGGQCLRDRQEFECLHERGGRNRLPLILGTAIPGVILLLILLIYLYRKKLRNYISSCTVRRNTSSDLYSKEDLEEGSAYFGIPVFSFSELKEATHNFDPSKELGDGGFGTVYYGKLQDGREVAVKRLYEHNYKRVAQFLNEIEILTNLRHPSLVTLYGCTSRHSRELLLVYEYIPNGTVADHIHGDQAKDHPLPWPIRMNIAIETASALAYLHASEIVHRDVKTNNILLDNNFCVKVADFGLSRLFPNDVSHVSTAPQGTPGYVDPDYHQCYQLTAKSDVYSFGVVLIELISSLPAVDISRHRHEINLANLAINRIQNGAFNELIDLSLGFESDSSVERMTTSVAEVAFQCLQLEKEMRPSMNEVLEALKEIQEYKDEEIGKMPPPSPDGDKVELLKSSKVPPSPDSVTNRWVSSSNTTISGE